MSKRKILIIDDEDDIVETTTFILQARGYDIVTAPDGLEGMQKAKKELPDLILLDISMPIKDGYEVCRELKKDKATKNMPVIMFTAKGDTESIEKAYKAGANDYIAKPYNIPSIVSKINNILSKKRS